MVHPIIVRNSSIKPFWLIGLFTNVKNIELVTVTLIQKLFDLDIKILITYLPEIVPELGLNGPGSWETHGNYSILDDVGEIKVVVLIDIASPSATH